MTTSNFIVDTKNVGPSTVQPGIKIVVNDVVYERFPIKMPRLIQFGENLEDLFSEYVMPHRRKGDWVMLSEKIVSISQNRVRHISTVKVSRLARFILRGVRKHKNMTAWAKPEKIQLAIEEAGIYRIIPAMILGGIGKLFGIRGIFWIIAGSHVSEIDGFIPEDMYPYTEWAVLPPPDPQGVCDGLEEKLGIGVVTADANYINVKVLGVSKSVGLDKKTVRKILLDNPIGQGNKMTPFALVRKVS
jgi:hypothetical protein